MTWSIVRPGGSFCALLLCLSSCIGWSSASLPPALTSEQKRIVEGAHVPLTVGVVQHVHPAYSDRLVEGLQDTGLFDRVAPIHEFGTPPDLVAQVAAQIHGTAKFPFWTLLTFGILPSFASERAGYSFWLSTPSAPEDRCLVEYTHTGRTTLGWIALLDVFLPRRTVFPFDVYDSRSMRGRLSLAILTQARDVLPETSAAPQ